MTITCFIDLLSDYLNQRKTKQPLENVEWKELMRIAKLHEVDGIVYYQCKEFVPEDYRISLDKSNAAILFYYANRVKEEKAVLQKLRDVGVCCFIVKGSTVASYYPVPALRTMGDTDIVVDDVEKAHNVLMAAGYTCRIKYALYHKRNLLIEVHDHLAYVNTVNNIEQVVFFNGYCEYVKDGELEWNFHLLFLIFHLRYHFYSSGVGIRQFMDIAVLTKYNQTLDWPWIVQKLKELEMWTFSQKVFDLNRRWFGIKIPIDVEAVNEEFYREATVELCSGGVFGAKDNSSRRIAAHGYNHPLRSMFNQAISTVFVPYKSMIRMPQYAFLVGKPYFLPFAWVYRGLLTIRKRGIKSTTRSIRSSFVSSKDLEEQKEYIDKWNQ